MGWRRVALVMLTVISLGGVAAITGCEKAVEGPDLGDAGAPPQGQAPPGDIPQVTVSRVHSEYPVAPGNLSGWFTSGQEADIMLSGINFNDSGGPLLFNHPKGIATDGTRLLLADGNNHRVLIWNRLPDGNVPPDVVLGQPDSTSNRPGNGRHQLNWPVAVATDGRRVLVADTYNDRILIWQEFPTRNGQPADLVLDGTIGYKADRPSKTGFAWPWGVWTDGNRLVVTSTRGGYVLIWSTFPSRENQPADILLTAGGNMGTPRSITSDGNCLIVGDHNARNTSYSTGNFFWSSFPTEDDQPYDFFRSDPVDRMMSWMTGGFTADGRLVMLGSTLHIWNGCPKTAVEPPALSISGFRFAGGDGASVAIAGERLYVSLYNGNRVVAYRSIPTDPMQVPDFAVGSPDVHTNTLHSHYFVTNGVPATDGRSLFVSSDFDRRLYVWRELPDRSGAHPDLIYDLPEAPWDNALWGDTLVLAGRDTVFVWNELPLDGDPPDLILRRMIGGVDVEEIKGVALDDRYFYLADYRADAVYVWAGVPDADTPPEFTIPVKEPWRLSSDGDYLAVTSIYNHEVYLYHLSNLGPTSKPVVVGGIGTFNLPQAAIVSGGSLFVADTGFHRVHAWRRTADALAGRPADVVLGRNETWVAPITGKDSFFNPAGLAFDGSYLWVGEFKFSFRLLRFSVR